MAAVAAVHHKVTWPVCLLVVLYNSMVKTDLGMIWFVLGTALFLMTKSWTLVSSQHQVSNSLQLQTVGLVFRLLKAFLTALPWGKPGSVRPLVVLQTDPLIFAEKLPSSISFPDASLIDAVLTHTVSFDRKSTLGSFAVVESSFYFPIMDWMVPRKTV